MHTEISEYLGLLYVILFKREMPAVAGLCGGVNDQDGQALHIKTIV